MSNELHCLTDALRRERREEEEVKAACASRELFEEDFLVGHTAVWSAPRYEHVTFGVAPCHQALLSLVCTESGSSIERGASRAPLCAGAGCYMRETVMIARGR